MLALLLQTTQLARQVAPNVYVTVQPPPGGMPEWAKILISAATGAVFALLGSLGMELLKRRLDRKETTNAVSKQLADELTHNLRLVDSARRIFADAAKAQEDSRIAAVFVLQLMTTAATTDRYEDNFEKKKGTVHELDPKQSLAQFYRLFPRTLKGQEDFAAASSFLDMASKLGHNYLESHQIPFDPKLDFDDSAYWTLFRTR